jgi:DNA-directed RNA polymerase subunit M/transcription elongation factor TFIIS
MVLDVLYRPDTIHCCCNSVPDALDGRSVTITQIVCTSGGMTRGDIHHAFFFVSCTKKKLQTSRTKLHTVVLRTQTPTSQSCLTIHNTKKQATPAQMPKTDTEIMPPPAARPKKRKRAPRIRKKRNSKPIAPRKRQHKAPVPVAPLSFVPLPSPVDFGTQMRKQGLEQLMAQRHPELSTTMTKKMCMLAQRHAGKDIWSYMMNIMQLIVVDIPASVVHSTSSRSVYIAAQAVRGYDQEIRRLKTSAQETARVALEEEEEPSFITCTFCGVKNVKYIEKNTRRVDEGPKLFFYCKNKKCRKRWVTFN